MKLSRNGEDIFTPGHILSSSNEVTSSLNELSFTDSVLNGMPFSDLSPQGTGDSVDRETDF